MFKTDDDPDKCDIFMSCIEQKNSNRNVFSLGLLVFILLLETWSAHANKARGCDTIHI